KGIEVGHIFKLGTFFSEALGATFLDSEGQQQPIIMGCYGIGVGRLLAAAIEQNNDENGIVYPTPIAPYQVHLIGLNMSNEEVAEASGRLYQEMEAAGVEVLYDDREDAAAGVKFNDADLLGLPIRLVVSPRNMKNGVVEVKGRTDSEAGSVPLEGVVEEVRRRLAAAAD
ncbi:MAG: His/Gly/Thr/Pro-type tRNA ligase C-terminal domain-containing protein, partial [Dehalococcoidia bacterium]